MEQRFAQTLGGSSDAIHAAALRALDARGVRGGMLVDVGCGSGALLRRVADRFEERVGVDAVRYDGLPSDVRLVEHDLDAGVMPLADGSAHVVTALEVIEHLENPRAFVRELARIVRHDGFVVVSTPNQLSLLSKGTLLLKNRFSAFQDASYPAHLSALLEVDLVRAAEAAGLADISIEYTLHGRVPLLAAHYPVSLARAFPRALSDNVLLVARKR